MRSPYRSRRADPPSFPFSSFRRTGNSSPSSSSWQWYDRNKFADPQNVPFDKYDRINYAFFQPDPDGFIFGTDVWADPQLLWGPYVTDASLQNDENKRCSWDFEEVDGGATKVQKINCNWHDLSKGILHLAQSKGVEVMPSIGGWTLSDNFPGIAADPDRRERFAQQCVDLIVAYGFDGIDIDWEYPGEYSNFCSERGCREPERENLTTQSRARFYRRALRQATRITPEPRRTPRTSPTSSRRYAKSSLSWASRTPAGTSS